MKKFLMGLCLLCMLGLSSACFKEDNLEGVKIYTSVYPITYLTEQLYGKYATIESIFPDGADVNNYTLTEKQIKQYSTGEIFIYNGLSNEKQIAKSLLNKNKKMKIIDVSYGLKYAEATEELWLSPNYYLMLATTIKTNLQDLIKSKYIKEEIDTNYKIIEEKLSIMDAELRSVSEAAATNGSSTLIVSSNMFKFLENYGFTIISLEEEQNKSTNNLNNIKSNFKSNKYKYIFMTENEEETETIKTLKDSYNASLVKVNTMNTLSKDAKEKNENYLTIMNSFIEAIKEATLN